MDDAYVVGATLAVALYKNVDTPNNANLMGLGDRKGRPYIRCPPQKKMKKTRHFNYAYKRRIGGNGKGQVRSSEIIYLHFFNHNKGIFMQTIVVQINNDIAFTLLENLEALNIIKLLKRMPSSRPLGNLCEDSDRAARLSEIRSITRDIHLDLTKFRFNRDEANSYDN